MTAFTTALAAEVSLAQASLLRARERHDDAAATEALERLRDLEEIGRRARDGLELAGR